MHHIIGCLKFYSTQESLCQLCNVLCNGWTLTKISKLFIQSRGCSKDGYSFKHAPKLSTAVGCGLTTLQQSGTELERGMEDSGSWYRGVGLQMRLYCLKIVCGPQLVLILWWNVSNPGLGFCCAALKIVCGPQLVFYQANTSNACNHIFQANHKCGPARWPVLTGYSSQVCYLGPYRMASH